MQVQRRAKLLVLMDKVGISDGYKGIWENLCRKHGLPDSFVRISLRSTYRTFQSNRILEWHLPSKLPGFSTNSNTQDALRRWVQEVIIQHEPDAILCMDPALLFLYNDNWNQAKLDTLRGGVYILFGIPHVVCFPITAYHSKAKPKDLAKLNDGFIEKGDFTEFQQESTIDGDDDSEDEDDDEDKAATFDRDSDDDRHVTRHMMQWHDPIVVPYGRIVLGFDLEKTSRILTRVLNHEAGTKARNTNDLLGAASSENRTSDSQEVSVDRDGYRDESVPEE